VFSVVLIQNKGRDDAHAVKTGPLSSSNHPQCVDRCRAQERRCLVDCIAQHDPVAGSVMRCVMLQNELHINNRARMTIRLRYAKAAGSFMRAQAHAALTERDALAGRK
jgi:hypothetical protein